MLRLTELKLPLDHGEGATTREYPVELLGRGGHQLGHLGLDDLRALEEVAVLEEVGLERRQDQG